MGERSPISKPLNILLILASLVVIIAGIRSAESIIIPMLLALFIAALFSPILFWAQKKSIPNWISILVIAISVFLFFILTFTVIGSSIQSIINEMPEYQASLQERWQAVDTCISDQGIDPSVFNISRIIESREVLTYVVQFLNSMTSVIEDGIIVFILVIFMLLATFKFPAKIMAMSSNKNTLKEIDTIIQRISHYIAIKTIISLITGILVTVFLLIAGVNHAIFLGFIAFLLNYIPNIGSIIAAIPAVMMAILQSSLEMALIVIAGYVIINIVMGNILEPRIMGKSTELSTVMIFASLIFWGWLLGPVGMFLSVPMMIISKIVFEHYEGTRWLSILLGPDN